MEDTQNTEKGIKIYKEVDYYKSELPKGIKLQGFKFGKSKTTQDD